MTNEGLEEGKTHVRKTLHRLTLAQLQAGVRAFDHAPNGSPGGCFVSMAGLWSDADLGVAWASWCYEVSPDNSLAEWRPQNRVCENLNAWLKGGAMLGHFVNNLSPVQEDAVLLQPFRSGHRRTNPDPNNECLVELVTHVRHMTCLKWPLGVACRFVPFHYDDLCTRFGEVRVNAAIRNRVLANRVRRLLAAPPVKEEVTV